MADVDRLQCTARYSRLSVMYCSVNDCQSLVDIRVLLLELLNFSLEHQGKNVGVEYLFEIKDGGVISSLFSR
jgi:hypothetical protein